MQRLELKDPFKAELVKLRFFGGMNTAELAQTLTVSEPTIKRHWEYARARLFQ